MNEMRLPKKEDIKFALLGSGAHLCSLAEMLIKRKFQKPVIVTHPKIQHSRDKVLLKKSDVYSDVFEIAKKYSLEIIETEIVNDPDLIKKLSDLGVNTCFSLSCRSIIKSNFINAFDRRIFNIHPSLLPKERGGGTHSYRIMNNVKTVAVTIHILDEGIDSGDIVFQKKKEIKMEYPYPSDYEKETQNLYKELLSKFLDVIEKGEVFKLSPQKNDESTYLPRLYTELNGAIDWSWDDKEIERFIRAFGDPYPGAFTFIDDKLIRILKARLEPSEITFHPFVKGKVITILSNGNVKVALRDHVLIIEEVIYENKTCKPSEICKTKNTFFTPREYLDRAKLEIPNVKNMCDVPKAFVKN
jgi:methionyl-tRNA formyltransferase